jgi:hypothetical protein
MLAIPGAIRVLQIAKPSAPVRGRSLVRLDLVSCPPNSWRCRQRRCFWLGSAMGAAVSALVIAVILPTSIASAQRGGPSAVIYAYESARNRGDMDTVVALFSDDAVVLDSTGKEHVGAQQIRLLLQPSVSPDWAADITQWTITGDRVYWTERVGVRGTARSVSVAAIVGDGSIKALTYGGRQLAPSDMPNAGKAPALPATYGLALVLLAMLGSLRIILLTTPNSGHSALRGSLVAHLRQWTDSRQQRRSYQWDGRTVWRPPVRRA